MHASLEKAVCHVNRSPNFPFGTIIQNVVNPWERVRVRNRISVKLPVIIHPTGQY
jgi:hypothetical protein